MKKLSVVIPTLNRRKYLEDTLKLLLPQIKRNLENVELIICNNASNDDTDNFLIQLLSDNSFVNYYYFEEYVEITSSISRSIGKTTGEYVLIFGDDDIPSPYYIDFILEILSSIDKDIGLISFNRLVGNDTKQQSIKNMYLHSKIYRHIINRYSLSEFIYLYSVSPGFVSSAVFLRSSWRKGLPYHSSRQYGYDFLGVFYNGMKGLDCLHVDYPFLIQRQPYSRDWLHKFPLYRLVGVPNLMKDLDSTGVCIYAFKEWNKKENKSIFRFCYVLLVASAYKNEYKKYCREINSHQHNRLRKLLTYLIIYFVPSFVYRYIRKYLIYNN